MTSIDPARGLLLLAIDNSVLRVRENLCLYMSKPAVRAEPVLKPSPRVSSAPDNCAAMFYGTVLEDPGPFGGRFRMWYHACHWGMNPDWPPAIARQFAKYKDPMLMGPPCYAESDDGIVWSKPSLGQVLFKGTRDNNAIDLPHGLTGGVNVIRDDEDPDERRCYKMVYEFYPRHSDPPLEGAGRMSTVVTAVSADGLHWTVTGIPWVDRFIEQSGLYRHQGKYIVGYQAGGAWDSHFSEGGHPAGRSGLVRYSYDFDHWTDGCIESLLMAEPADPVERGARGSYIQNHMGVAAASFGNVCVGLYGLWHNRPDFVDNSCDLGLAVSNDGMVFREPVKGHAFIRSEESPAPPHPDRHFNTNLCQGNGILNVGDETRIYHGRWRNTGFDYGDRYYGEIALATLPRDRWGGLGLFPNRGEGWVWTEPLDLGKDGSSLFINAEGADGMQVEIADEAFRPLPEYSGENAGTPASDGLDIPVEWLHGTTGLGGATVRLKVTLRSETARPPRLYGLRVRGARFGSIERP